MRLQAALVLMFTAAIVFAEQALAEQQQRATRDPMAPVGGQSRESQPKRDEAVTQTGNNDSDDDNQPTELDLPEDSQIKIRVAPVIVNSLVDRVAEPAKVYVECPQALSAEVYLVPVDAPYGGLAIGKPRLIGKDMKPTDGLTIPWIEKESAPYVKLFAVVRKRSQPDKRVRSHTIDLAMTGVRYAAKTHGQNGQTAGSSTTAPMAPPAEVPRAELPQTKPRKRPTAAPPPPPEQTDEMDDQ